MHRSLRSLQLGVNWLPDRPGSGLDRMYYGLAQHLPAADVHVDGVVLGNFSSCPLHSGSIKPVARASDALPRRLWAYRRFIHRYLNAHSPDILAAHFALYAATVLDRVNDYPFVVHFHGPWAHESAAEGEPAWKVRLKSFLESHVYRRGTRFIVLSSAFRDVLTKRYDVSPDRVRIVPGGVEIDRYDTGCSRKTARESLGWPTDRPIVVSVRRLVRRVGLDRLIQAIDLLRHQVPDVLLYIAGKGPLRDELSQQIQERNLSNHAELLGFVPDADLPFVYRAANLSVVPTVAHEGFGLVVIESLAAGTPPLVTPIGGLPEIVTDLSESLLLPNAQPATIADRIQDILTGNASLPSSEQCKHYAHTRYAWPVVASQVRAVYDEVV